MLRASRTLVSWKRVEWCRRECAASQSCECEAGSDVAWFELEGLLEERRCFAFVRASLLARRRAKSKPSQMQRAQQEMGVSTWMKPA
eukprot:2527910-Rhodomonas_salina.1